MCIWVRLEMAQAMAVNPSKAPGRGAKSKKIHDMVTTKEIIEIVLQNLKVFYQRLKKQVKVEIIRILPCFQEEMMTQENSVGLENMMA